MSDKDYIKELFQSKLEAFESPVDPSLWSAVQSQLPAVAAKGLSLVAKVIIGLSSAAVVSTVALVALNSNSDEKKEPKKESIELSSNDKIDDKEISSENTESKVLSNQETSEASNPSNITSDKGLNIVDKADEELEPLVMEWPIKLDQERLTQEDKLTPDTQQDKTTESKTKADKTTQDKSTEAKTEEQKGEENTTTTQASSLPDIQKLSLPNTFTPNGDRLNDELFVESNGLKDFSLVVLDSRNQVVYKTNDPDFKWNGHDLFGSPVPDGDYMYIVTALDEYNRPVNASNRLRIVR